MRVVVFVKATEDSEAGVLPPGDLLEQMGKYNEELVDAGIMLGGDGLKPSSQAKRVAFDGLSRTVNASDTDQVLYRLRTANIVRQMPDGWRATGGRPTNIWEVNPALAHTEVLPERAERAERAET